MPPTSKKSVFGYFKNIFAKKPDLVDNKKYIGSRGSFMFSLISLFYLCIWIHYDINFLIPISIITFFSLVFVSVRTYIKSAIEIWVILIALGIAIIHIFTSAAISLSVIPTFSVWFVVIPIASYLLLTRKIALLVVGLIFPIILLMPYFNELFLDIFPAYKSFELISQTQKNFLNLSTLMLTLFSIMILLNQYIYVRDVAIKNLEKSNQDLEQAKKQLIDSQTFKEHFYATASHEIRNPMNTVIGLAHLLKNDDKFKDDVNVRYLDMSANHLMSILNELLDFFKLEKGKSNKIEIPFDLHELCKNTFELVKLSNATNKDIQFHFEFGENLHKNFIGDPKSIKQILYNLLNNALKFTEKGEIKLIVRSWKDGVEMEINDTGVGIEKNKIEEMFIPYTQGNIKGNYQLGGTGLGLHITQKLVQVLHGHINCESEPGKGTQFIVRIPMNTSLEESLVEHEVNDTGLTNLTGNILVVDDDKLNLMVLEKQIKQKHPKLTVKIALNKEEVLKHVNSMTFDIVVADYNMPDINGIDLCKMLYNDYNLKECIIATGDTSQQLMNEISHLNIIRKQIIKPIRLKDLSREFKEILSQHTTLD